MATQQFQRELRRWRTRKGLTQRALADRVRFSRETVAAVEAGRRYGSQELAVRCDEVLGTGGLLAALWPRVAVEQIAADGRRGPRVTGLGSGPPGHGGDSTVSDPQSVVDAIDELRELIDQMLRVHLPADQRPDPAPGHRRPVDPGPLPAEVIRQPAEPRRASVEAHRPLVEPQRRGRVGALGRPR